MDSILDPFYYECSLWDGDPDGDVFIKPRSPERKEEDELAFALDPMLSEVYLENSPALLIPSAEPHDFPCGPGAHVSCGLMCTFPRYYEQSLKQPCDLALEPSLELMDLNHIVQSGPNLIDAHLELQKPQQYRNLQGWGPGNITVEDEHRCSFPSPPNHLRQQQRSMFLEPALARNRRRRVASRLTYQQRRRICQYHEEHPNTIQNEIGAVFGLDRSTISKILKHKEKYLKPDDEELLSKEMVTAKIAGIKRAEHVNRTVATWVRKKEREGHTVIDKDIDNMTHHFAQAIGNMEGYGNFDRTALHQMLEVQKTGLRVGEARTAPSKTAVSHMRRYRAKAIKKLRLKLYGVNY